ncbi:MAG: OmpA family protein [Sulfurospirillaceae bacterium]|nr:OmpA family protein [Sulfurospirillaceae bacterium]
MKKKCKKTECPAGEKWAVPYADFLSLLLALFIALYALASVNKKKMDALKAAFVQIYSYTPKPEQMNPVIRMSPRSGEASKSASTSLSGSLPGAKSVLSGGTPNSSQGDSQKSTSSDLLSSSSTAIQGGLLMQNPQIKKSIASANEMIKKQDAGTEISIKESEKGFIINLPASLLFKKDSAKITSVDATLLLKRIVLIMKEMPKSTDILVNGYTDNIAPSKDSAYKDNWQLSAARALSVVKVLMQDGIDGNRLGVVGYGQYRPIASNTTEEGRKKNRRVTISFMAKKSTKKTQQKDVLDRNRSKNQ